MSDGVHWQVDGDPTGEPVLFLNPLGAPLALWDELLQNLRGRYRVVRFDLPGHGQSAIKPGWLQPSLAHLAVDAVGVLDSAEVERAHLVGLSLGAMVALEVAAAAPRRVASLALMCTSAHFELKQVWNERIQHATTHGLTELADPSLERWFTPAWRATHPEPVAQARAMFLSTHPHGYAAAARAVRDMDLRPRLAQVQAPALVVAGRDDPSTPPDMGQFIAHGVSGARYVELEGAHWLPVEQPGNVAVVLEQHWEASRRTT